MPTNPANRNPQPTNLPREVGGYEIQRVLGTGGMATVYAALQKQPRRTVAIKVMSGAINAESAMHRFKREIEILGRLRHPFIAQVYAAGVHEDGGLSLPYFVMEYVPGARTIIAFAEGRELNVRERLKLFIKVCAAVEHGHRHKIIHRDLKPGNILIDEVGEPKVIDFGVARAVEPDVTSQTMHTEEGRLIGTLQYMAPEQLETTRQDLDARCDVYALGVLLYKLLTGRPPHDLVGLPVFTAAQVIREDVPPRPSTIRSEIKGDLETIILRALAKDKLRRYANAGSLARDLIRFLAAKPIKAREASRLYRASLFLRRHRSETRATAVVAVVVIAAAAAMIWQRRSLGPRNSPEAAPSVTAPAPKESDPTPDRVSMPPDDSRDPGSPDDVDVPDSFAIGAPEDRATSLAFDPEGSVLAQATHRHAIRWWDFETDEMLRTTFDHADAVQHLAFSGDGSRLASASADGVVMMVERDGSGTTPVIPRTRFSDVYAMTLDKGGATLAIACGDLTVRVMTADGSIRHVLRGTDGAFRAVAFSHDTRMVAAGSENGAVYVWDAARGGEPDRYRGLRQPVVGVGFTADNDHIVAVTTGGHGMIWPRAGGRPQGRPLVVDVDVVGAVAFDATGGRVACASAGQVQIFAIPSGAPVGNVEAPEDARIATIALSPDAYWIAIGREDGGVDAVPVAERWTAGE